MTVSGQRRGDVLRRTILAGAILAGLTGCKPKSPEFIFRVKLTFHFQGPTGDKSFSGVWEIQETHVSGFPDTGGGLVETLIGEAIPMHFDNGRIAFAMLVDYGGGKVEIEDAIGLFTWNAGRALHNAHHPLPGDLNDLIAASSMQPSTLAQGDYPAFIYFEDLADPSTGRLVSAAELSTIAGPGWAFDRAEVQVVQGPRTLGASQLLPWLGKRQEEGNGWRWNNFLSTQSISCGSRLLFSAATMAGNGIP